VLRRWVMCGVLLHRMCAFTDVCRYRLAERALRGKDPPLLYALVGAGCSNIVPVMFSAVGRQTVMPETVAVPAITTLGYAGVLAGPPPLVLFPTCHLSL
jgi:hypothetical protein